MSATTEALCCVPVLLIWLGPLALLLGCLAFGGCAKLKSLLTRSTPAQD